MCPGLLLHVSLCVSILETFAYIETKWKWRRVRYGGMTKVEQSGMKWSMHDEGWNGDPDVMARKTHSRNNVSIKHYPHVDSVRREKEERKQKKGVWKLDKRNCSCHNNCLVQFSFVLSCHSQPVRSHLIPPPTCSPVPHCLITQSIYICSLSIVLRQFGMFSTCALATCICSLFLIILPTCSATGCFDLPENAPHQASTFQ